MAVKILKLAGKEFVILSKQDYMSLKSRASKRAMGPPKRVRRMTRQDVEDVAEANRVLADPREKFIPWEDVREKLG